MRIISFTTPDHSTPRPGALSAAGDTVVDFCAAGIEPPGDYLGWFDLDGEPLRQALVLCERPVDQLGEGVLLAREDVRLCAPVPRPGKYVCIGLNYRDHAAESGMPVPESPIVFSKFTTAVIAPGESVRIPPGSEQVDYEAELAVVIGRRASRLSQDEALDYVLGYACTNDVSARDFQFADGQWQRGKSCDTFAPLGEFIATKDEIPDPHNLAIRLRLNGETMQDSNTDQLVFGVPGLVAFLSQSVTLEPGDVIATGTPPGVGFARKPPVFLKDGDLMEVDIEGLGVLRNPIVGEA